LLKEVISLIELGAKYQRLLLVREVLARKLSSEERESLKSKLTWFGTMLGDFIENRERRATPEQLKDEARRLKALYGNADLRQIIRMLEKGPPQPTRTRRLKGTMSWNSAAGLSVKFEIMLCNKLIGLGQLEACVTWQELRPQNPDEVLDLSYFVDLEPESLKKAVFGR
jgi:hypothetical protein